MWHGMAVLICRARQALPGAAGSLPSLSLRLDLKRPSRGFSFTSSFFLGGIAAASPAALRRLSPLRSVRGANWCVLMRKQRCLGCLEPWRGCWPPSRAQQGQTFLRRAICRPFLVVHNNLHVMRTAGAAHAHGHCVPSDPGLCSASAASLFYCLLQLLRYFNCAWDWLCPYILHAGRQHIPHGAHKWQPAAGQHQAMPPGTAWWAGPARRGSSAAQRPSPPGGHVLLRVLQVLQQRAQRQRPLEVLPRQDVRPRVIVGVHVVLQGRQLARQVVEGAAEGAEGVAITPHHLLGMRRRHCMMLMVKG